MMVSSMRPVGKGSSIRACAPINARRVQAHQRVAELIVVKDTLDDGFVALHTTDDRVHELPVEHEPEVVERVVARLRSNVAVGKPRLLELIEQQLVTFVEVQAEPFV